MIALIIRLRPVTLPLPQPVQTGATIQQVRDLNARADALLAARHACDAPALGVRS